MCRSDLHRVENLKSVILQSLSASPEELKTSASYALGGVAIGNLQQFLPFILHEIETHPKRQYLLLHSLKDVNFFFILNFLFFNFFCGGGEILNFTGN